MSELEVQKNPIAQPKEAELDVEQFLNRLVVESSRSNVQVTDDLSKVDSDSPTAIVHIKNDTSGEFFWISTLEKAMDVGFEPFIEHIQKVFKGFTPLDKLNNLIKDNKEQDLKAAAGSGSAFLINNNGKTLLVSNNHVLIAASKAFEDTAYSSETDDLSILPLEPGMYYPDDIIKTLKVSELSNNDLDSQTVRLSGLGIGKHFEIRGIARKLTPEIVEFNQMPKRFEDNFIVAFKADADIQPNTLNSINGSSIKTVGGSSVKVNGGSPKFEQIDFTELQGMSGSPVLDQKEEAVGALHSILSIEVPLEIAKELGLEGSGKLIIAVFSGPESLKNLIEGYDSKTTFDSLKRLKPPSSR